ALRQRPAPTDRPAQPGPVRQSAERYGTYGVFKTADGAVCRHHPSGWFTTLLAELDPIATRHITVPTMNGQESEGIQLLTRKSPHHHAHIPTS
ncbi:hypothetical protein, partial [Arthrobacter sp. TS-15]|uniref:hypothetical protein n=1 Tax=Arthrobacter sp. TS-15 TaxID=2510797 RepID=UPI001930E831